MPEIQITGTLDPDAVGVYAEAGIYNGKPYYRRGGDAWYVWSIDDGGWETWLSTALGSGAEGWFIAGDSPIGTMEPGGGLAYTGNPLLQWVASLVEALPGPFCLPPYRRQLNEYLLPIGSASPIVPLPPSVAEWMQPLAAPLIPPPSPHALRPSPFAFCPLPVVPEPDLWESYFSDRIWPRAGLPAALLLAPSFFTPTFDAAQFPFPPPGNPLPRVRPALQTGLDVFRVIRVHHHGDARGKYRVFNAAEYRFYRSDSAPPAEGAVPFATSATLPATPAETYADGTWYLSCSYFNGVIDSGFLPLGPNGETYLTLMLSGGAEVGNPPNGPVDWRLEQTAGGVVRVHGVYCQDDALRADGWAIAYTTDGSTPPADAPDLDQNLLGAAGLEVLQYDLPAVAHGTLVKVRLQLRRNDGSDAAPDWVYSAESTVKTLTVSTTGPAAPLGGDRWPGPLQEPSA
jgi:hypothetical protein